MTKMVLNKLRDGKAPVILAVNKVDNVRKGDFRHTCSSSSQSDELPRYQNPISAETGLNVDTIAGIVRVCRKRFTTSRKITSPTVRSALWLPRSFIES